MRRTPPKTNASKDEDEYTPEQRRKIDARLAISEAQYKAGLSYGPYDSASGPLKSILKARKHTRRLSIDLSRCPAQLLGRGSQAF